MAVTKNSGRQELVSAYVDIAYTDLAVSGTAYEALDLPKGAVVVDEEFIVNTAWNSGTSDVLDIGDGALGTRYATGLNIHTTGLKAATPTGYVHTPTTNKIVVKWTGAGAAPTAGQGRLQVRYYVENRATFSQG